MPESEVKREELELHPFMRNKYFYGKLMTVEDFELEQEYFNRKRYLLNRLIFGKGLLYGFHNIELNTKDKKVNIIFKDGGVALDSLGQEIVVPKNTEKTIQNKYIQLYEEKNFGDTIHLYLKYNPSFAVSEVSEFEKINSKSESNNCSRILEDFEVIACFKSPMENTIEEMVFFATIKRNHPHEKFTIVKIEDSRLQNNLIDQPKEPAQSNKGNIIATGVVYFKQPTVNSITSSPIDLKLKGMDHPVFIHLSPEEGEENKIFTDHYGSGQKNDPPFHLRTILDRSIGTFKVQVVFKDESERRSVHIRWWAFRSNKDYGTTEVTSNVFLTEYKFLSDPDPNVRAKVVENSLSHSGAKNYVRAGIIQGNHYAKVGNEVALNGNPNRLARLLKEQDDEPKNLHLHSEWDKWYIGEKEWMLKLENFDNTSNGPAAEIKLYFEEKEMKSFKVFKGDLITYCESIAGETNVPLFVTYVDDIHVPSVGNLFSKEAKVVLKYTWAVSKRHIRYCVN